MSMESRIEAIEKKLGIEPPAEEYGFFWDNDPSEIRVGKLTEDEPADELRYECDGGDWYKHFVAFMTDELARFREKGLFLKK